jgi:predicted nuclease of predicted toxin-antitoxin system
VIRLLLDMGLPRRAAADLREQQFAVDHAGELGLATTPDEEILETAAREGYVVVTLDFDFVRLAALRPRNRPSIIHLRLPNLDRAATVTLLREILPQLETELERGCIASVGRRGIRVRSLPIALSG